MKLIAVISITALVLLNAPYKSETSPANRPVRWAKPMQMIGLRMAEGEIKYDYFQ